MKNPQALLSVALITILFSPLSAFALPEGIVTSGSADLISSGNTLTVNQSSHLVSISYDSFNIAASEIVNFNQPDANSIALNQITGVNATEIFGSLNANGQVFLINPNGILFAPGSQVNVGGLLASTLSISDENFFNQNFVFDASSTGSSIQNFGQLLGGYVALISPAIANHGDIVADNISLHAADSVLVSFSPAIHIETLSSSYEATIENKGLISATGGEVVLTAASHNELLETAINNEGVIQASGLIEKAGRVFLVAEDQGDVINSGEVSSSAAEFNGVAGDILIEAERVAQLGVIHADGLGHGDGGQVHLLADHVVALGENSITTANAGETGHGGQVIALSPDTTLFRQGAVIEATGGGVSGNGGYVDVSGFQHVEAFGLVDVYATLGEHGTFIIDPTNITITTVDTNMTVAPTFQATTAGATLDIITLAAALETGAAVEVRTDTGFDAGEAGNITIDPVVINYDSNSDGTSGSSLSLIADGDIIFSAGSSIRDSTPGDASMDVTLTAGGDIVFFDNTLIQTGDGNFIASAGSLFRVDPSSIGGNSLIDTGNGTISITTGGNARLGGLLTTNSTTAALNLNIGGDITDGGSVYVDIVALSGQSNITANGSVTIETSLSDIDYTFTGGTAGIINSGALNVIAGSSLNDVSLTTTSGNLNVSGNIDTNGADGSTLTLNANQDLNISAGVTIGDLTAVDDNVNINLVAGSNLIMADTSLVDAVGGLINVTTTTDATISSLQTSNATASAITMNIGNDLLDGGDALTDIVASNGQVNIIAAGDIGDLDALETDINQLSINIAVAGKARFNETNNVELTSVTNVTDLEVNAAAGIITIPDAGLNVSGNLSLTAQDLVDADRTVVLAGQNLTLDLTAMAGDVAINSTLTSLDVTMSGANRNLTVNETDGITINNLTGLNNFSLTSSAGIVTIPDAGLNVSGNLSLIVQDLIDADRTINVTATDLLMDIGSAAGDMSINTSVDRLNINFTGAAGSTDLSITENNGLEISDLGINSPYALSNSDGNISLQVLAGDLIVNDSVIASDLTADGVRSGMIDFTVDSGDMMIGTLGSTIIDSVNTVDQGASGGLDGNQVAVRFQNPNTGNLDANIIIGDDIAGDVAINVVGGDFEIVNSTSVILTGGNTRDTVIGSDVTIEVYNNIIDPLTGITELEGITNSGILNVHSGRNVSLSSGVPASVIDQVETEVESEVASISQSESESEMEAVTDAPVSSAENQSPVQVVFNEVFRSCDESSGHYSKSQCAVEQELEKFLQSLLIGGQLPKVGNN